MCCFSKQERLLGICHAATGRFVLRVPGSENAFFSRSILRGLKLSLRTRGVNRPLPHDFCKALQFQEKRHGPSRVPRA